MYEAAEKSENSLPSPVIKLTGVPIWKINTADSSETIWSQMDQSGINGFIKPTKSFTVIVISK